MSDGILKLSTHNRVAFAFGITLEEAMKLRISSDRNSIQVPAGKVTLLSNTPKKSLEVGNENSAVLSPNQAALVSVPEGFKGQKYRVFVSVNPELFKFAMVSTPGLVDIKQLSGTNIGLVAHRKLDLDTFEWIFDLSVVR